MDKNILDVIRNIEEDRLYALLGYAMIFCVVPLLFRKDSELAVFHGRQGLALFLVEMSGFILSVIFPVLFRPFLIVFLVASLWGMIGALRGGRARIPLVHRLAERLVL